MVHNVMQKTEKCSFLHVELVELPYPIDFYIICSHFTMGKMKILDRFKPMNRINEVT